MEELNLEYFGFLAFIFIIIYSSYPAKIKNLEAKVKKFERNIKGDKSMSKILSQLKDKKCILTSDEGLTLVSKRDIECVILDVDDEWIKFTYTDKKGNTLTQILKIESIDRVTCL